MKKPNIVFIVADQWRLDAVGYAGNKCVKTPNIDALVEDGIGFENAYCQNPVCVPSRCSFLTGWYPHTKGYRTMHNLMPESEPNLLKTFKENDYHVYWGGRVDFLQENVEQMHYCNVRNNDFKDAFKHRKNTAQFVEDTAERQEMRQNIFSHYIGLTEGVYDPERQEFNQALKYLENDTYGEQPFLIYMALSSPHPPYVTEKQWYDQINIDEVDAPVRLTDTQWEKKASILRGIRANQKLYEWSDARLKELKKVYYAMGTKLDSYIGELIQKLKDKNIYDDTLIVFMSDHGDYTGDYEIAEKNQNTFEDMLTNVPLVIKLPHQEKCQSRVSDAMVELIDVQATLMDYAGLTYHHEQFGKSLRPVFEGSDEHRDVAFCEGGRLDGETQATDAGHNQSNPYWARTTEQERIPEHTKAMMIRNKNYKYIYRLYETDEFYDMENDPYETTNLIDHTEFAAEITQLRARMLEHFFKTGDVVKYERDERV